MGAHKTNPTAIQAAVARPVPPIGTPLVGFEFETVVELNKEKLAEVTAVLDTEKAAGRDPRRAITAMELDASVHPEWYDVVVYNCPMFGRSSSLIINRDRPPDMARLRWSEHMRVPYAQVIERANAAFAKREAAQRGDMQ